jgi:hypothetical protein
VPPLSAPTHRRTVSAVRHICQGMSQSWPEEHRLGAPFSLSGRVLPIGRHAEFPPRSRRFETVWNRVEVERYGAFGEDRSGAPAHLPVFATPSGRDEPEAVSQPSLSQCVALRAPGGALPGVSPDSLSCLKCRAISGALHVATIGTTRGHTPPEDLAVGILARYAPGADRTTSAPLLGEH